MILTRTHPPTEQPVTLAEMKEHLRVQHDAEDVVIFNLVNAATESVENRIGKAFVDQTWAYSFYSPSGVVFLPKVPLIEVESITYFDVDGVEQTEDLDNYWVNSYVDKAAVEPRSGFAWPTTAIRRDAITIAFRAGYGSQGAVPNDLKTAVMMTVQHWFHNRGVTSNLAQNEFPMGVESIIATHQVEFYG